MNKFYSKGKIACAIGLLGLCASVATVYAVSHDTSDYGLAVMSDTDEGSEIFSTDLSSQENFDKCTVVKSTGKWLFYKYGPYTRHSIYASDGASDDYIIIPGVELTAGKEYSITADCCKEASNDAFKATMEFCYGADATAESMHGISTSEIITAGFAAYNSDRFSVAESGTYCIALHANSPKMEATGGYLEIHVKKVFVTEYAGGAVEPPVAEKEEIYNLALTTENDFKSCDIVNNNNDKSTWKFYKYGPYVYYSAWLEDRTDADDYLVMPAVTLAPGKEYEISIEAKRGDDRWAETVAFYYGSDTDVAAMKEVSSHDVTATAFTPVTSSRFSVKTAGEYRIAIKAASPAIDSNIGQHELSVKNVVVTAYASTAGGEDPEPSDARTIPYSIVPTPEELGQLVIIDHNNDEFDRGAFQLGVWNYDSDNSALVYLYSSKGNAADDYVVLPKLRFDNTENAYNISLDAMVASSRNPESFEVYIGSTLVPEEMTLLYSSGQITNDENWETHSIPVGIKEAGDYYVAVKATSEKDQFKLMIKNISVTLTEMSVNIPGDPEYVTAEPAEKGALNALVSFRMPTANIAGDKLEGTVVMKIVSAAETKEVTGQPGDPMRETIATLQGDNTITVTPSNASGAGTPITLNVYTGVDKPRIPVAKATVSEDNLTLHIEWNADETGVSGGYVNPADVIYTVSRYDAADKTYDDGVKLTGKFSYDFSVDAASPLHDERFMITAENIAGREEGIASVHAIVGRPLSLPIDETIEGGKLTYSPLSVDIPDDTYLYTADFRLYTLADIFEKPDDNYAGLMDGHEKAIWAFIRYGEPGKGRFVFPKFSTEGIDEVKFKMTAFINSIFPETEVYATAYGVEPVKIGMINSEAGEGWTDIAFELPAELGNKKWVNVYFDAEFTDIDAQNIFISSYTFSELLANDIAVVSIDGPADAVNVGDKAVFTATVQNVGKDIASIPEVVFEVVDTENEVVATSTVTPAGTSSLYPEQKVEAVFELDATADRLGSYTVRAYVDLNDENPVNDCAEILLDIIKGQKPIVDDLEATPVSSGGAVSLSWSKPDIKLTGLDDFESYAPFHYGKYIGLFKNVDGDKKATYSYDQCQFDAATKPKAFMVTNPDYLNNKLVQENYTPRSGSQYLVAFCPNDGSKADDWLISPEVKPGTVISFYISVVGYAQFAERYEVCYSSTTNEPEAFSVLETGTATEMKWQGKAYILPDDAKYFAIHYVSSDVFGIMIDDIDYTPVINEKSTFAYNVYADGARVAENLRETAFTHTGLDIREYSYNVTAVVDGTEYNFSNTAKATVLGGVEGVNGDSRSIKAVGSEVIVEGYAGSNVSVYAIDGRCVHSAADCPDRLAVSLSEGVYIVNAGGDSVKVIVR